MTSTMPLVLILLAVLSASLYYLIQAEGGFSEFPRLMERVGISIDKIPIINLIFSSTNDKQTNEKPNNQ